MKKTILLSFLFLTLLASADDRRPNTQPSPQPDQSESASTVCSIHCKKGKACGNSCISRAKTCHKPQGIACDTP